MRHRRNFVSALFVLLVRATMESPDGGGGWVLSDTDLSNDAVQMSDIATSRME